MFSFEQFWEYTNQRINYDENIEYLSEFSNVSLNDLKQYPPQQCALPITPTLGPALLTRQAERRNVLRRHSSHALLRLSKTKQRDYLESVSKYLRKKYKRWTEKKQYENDEDWKTDDSYDSDEWETDSDYDSDDNTLNPPQLSLIGPIQQQQRILFPPSPSKPVQQGTPLLIKGAVSEALRMVSSKGKRLRRIDPKEHIKWKGDETKRLKMCISALMQMRFHDQLAYSGLLSSITLYMRTTLEMTSSAAAMAISIWTGLCYLTPLLSAYCADAKWGRANTLIIAQYIFFVGMFSIAISTYFDGKYYRLTHGLFWLGMVIVGVGFGGFKPTLSPLGADQFDAKHKSDAQKAIAKQKRSSFFGWLYWANQVGAIFASSVIAYICQNIDFSIGWSLASIALIFAIASYYSAKNYFICVPPEGSIFGDFLKVACISCRARCRGRKPPPVRLPSYTQTPSTEQSMSPYKHQYYSPIKPSMLDWNKECNGGRFDDLFVDDIKTALSALPALIPFPVAYIIYTNLLTLVYSQGCQMNVNMGNGFMFPISSLSLISTATIIVFVPLTEKYIYPAMNRSGGCLKVTPLKKMSLAFSAAVIAMLISGITEIIRKSSYVYQFPLSEMDSPCGSGLPVSDMSILWQSPQFFLLGMSRVLINTGAQDFFYTEAPKSMKSTLFSLNYAVDGFGAVCGSLSIMVVNSGQNPWITNDLNDGHLEYYFFVIGAIMCLLFGFFLIFANSYTYKEFKTLKRGKKLPGK